MTDTNMFKAGVFQNMTPMWSASGKPKSKPAYANAGLVKVVAIGTNSTVTNMPKPASRGWSAMADEDYEIRMEVLDSQRKTVKLESQLPEQETSFYAAQEQISAATETAKRLDWNTPDFVTLARAARKQINDADYLMGDAIDQRGRIESQLAKQVQVREDLQESADYVGMEIEMYVRSKQARSNDPNTVHDDANAIPPSKDHALFLETIQVVDDLITITEPESGKTMTMLVTDVNVAYADSVVQTDYLVSITIPTRRSGHVVLYGVAISYRPNPVAAAHPIIEIKNLCERITILQGRTIEIWPKWDREGGCVYT